ncbi:MAG: GNAT family N-acetyltransferase [Sphingomonas sp.]
MSDGVTYRLLGPDDEPVLHDVAEGVFDRPVDEALAHAFLVDPRHHLAVALHGNVVVGFVSAVDYVHPDKARQLWINEVGVAARYRRKGVARKLMQLILDHARELGCSEAWVLTDAENVPANALYQSVVSPLKADFEPQRLYSFQLR